MLFELNCSGTSATRHDQPPATSGNGVNRCISSMPLRTRGAAGGKSRGRFIERLLEGG
jgi:hypothetical protein